MEETKDTKETPEEIDFSFLVGDDDEIEVEIEVAAIKGPDGKIRPVPLDREAAEREKEILETSLKGFQESLTKIDDEDLEKQGDKFRLMGFISATERELKRITSVMEAPSKKVKSYWRTMDYDRMCQIDAASIIRDASGGEPTYSDLAHRKAKVKLLLKSWNLTEGKKPIPVSQASKTFGNLVDALLAKYESVIGMSQEDSKN